MTAQPVETFDPRAAAAALVVAVHDGDVLAAHRATRDLDMEALRLVAGFLASCVDPDAPLVPSTAVRLSPDDLVRLVVSEAATAFGVEPGALYGRSRKVHIQRARFVAIAVAGRLGLSGPQIGAALDRDHTTSYYAARRVNDDEVLDAVADKLVQRLLPRVFS